MDMLAYVLFGVAIILAIIVFAVNRKINGDVAIYAISLAIAVIPEGLVVVASIKL